MAGMIAQPPSAPFTAHQLHKTPSFTQHPLPPSSLPPRRPSNPSTLTSSASPPFRSSPPAAQTTAHHADASTLMSQEVNFTWKGEGSEVLLTGDFLNWDTKLALEKGSDGIFHLKQKLLPGSYLFKFIVDGKWMHSDENTTIPDGKGGFNNQIVIKEIERTDATSSRSTDKKLAGEAAGVAETETRKQKVVEPDQKPYKAVGKAARETIAATKGPKKVISKPLPILMVEDVIPPLKTYLEEQHLLSEVDVIFEDNQLQGCFIKNGIPYSFWAYFPDGKLEGSRGFSLSSHGAPPSTVEPFFIDEKKITPELIVFWITKRLFAQPLLSLN